MPLEDYQIISKIGIGRYSSVYHATRKSDGHPLALKKVPFQHMDHKGQTNAMHEAKLLERLSHPNIISLIEVVYDEEF